MIIAYITRIYRRNIALPLERRKRPRNKPKGRHKPRVAHSVYPDARLAFNDYWRYVRSEADATHYKAQ